jgi:DNA-binding MarR family transcriptional regulator
MSEARLPLDPARLQAGITAFVREFGLLQPNRTPCGRPISVSEAHALAELDRDAPFPQHELASRLRLEKSTVSRLVAQLERRGWVDRSRRSEDARELWLTLTAAGTAAAADLASAREARFAEILAAIPVERRPVVTDGLALLVEAVVDRRSAR